MVVLALSFKVSLTLITLASIAYYLICIYSANRFFGETEAAPSNDNFPPISILIPVRGIDHEAAQNFESLCLQDYPDFEILFGIQDPEDPVRGIIGELKQRFPGLRIRLIECRDVFGHNAKVSNLITLLKHAAHEAVLIVDSDIRVGAGYLRRIVTPLASPEVGLVTCPYRGIGAQTLGARVEAVGISSDFIPGVLVARQLEGIRFGLGATLLTRKSVVGAIGGLGQIADYLGDDFLLGNLIARRGFQVILSRFVVENVQAPDSIWTVLRHQLRWARSTKHSRPLGYAGLLFTHGMPACIALVISSHASAAALLLFLSTLALRYSVAIRVGILGLGDRLLWRNLWLVPFRDLVNFGVWCVSFVGDKIVWRGRTFRLKRGGRLVPISNGPYPCTLAEARGRQ